MTYDKHVREAGTRSHIRVVLTSLPCAVRACRESGRLLLTEAVSARLQCRMSFAVVQMRALVVVMREARRTVPEDPLA
jgi:hypothetical protein